MADFNRRDFLKTTAAAAAALACALARRGEVDEALQLVDESRASAVPGDILGESPWRRALALVATHEGRLDDATRLATDAYASVEGADWLTFRGEALEDLAYVHQQAGNEARATRSLLDALALYERKQNVASAQRVREALSSASACRRS